MLFFLTSVLSACSASSHETKTTGNTQMKKNSINTTQQRPTPAKPSAKEKATERKQDKNNRKIDDNNDTKRASDAELTDSDTNNPIQAEIDTDNMTRDVDSDILRGTWQLVGVGCPEGMPSQLTQAQNNLITSGGEKTFVTVLESDNPNSFFHVNLVSGIANCEMSQNFAITYPAPNTINVSTTGPVVENCSFVMDFVHTIEGAGYSFQGELRISNNEAAIRGRFPIRVAGESCSVGEPEYRFLRIQQ